MARSFARAAVTAYVDRDGWSTESGSGFVRVAQCSRCAATVAEKQLQAVAVPQAQQLLKNEGPIAVVCVRCANQLRKAAR